MPEAKDHKHAWDYRNCAVIVAHPDDETLWAGGTMLMHPESRWTVVTLCRAGDHDRATKFHRALEQLNATGAMGDLDDGPDQKPLPARAVQNTIVEMLTSQRFDLVITHGLWGEYTRHLRHEEVSRGVLALREIGRIIAREMWMFAYGDGGGKFLPQPSGDADLRLRLSEEIWQRKYDIITNIYGFSPDSFEARTTPREEAFWFFRTGKKVQ